jgi:hypothetical protein
MAKNNINSMTGDDDLPDQVKENIANASKSQDVDEFDKLLKNADSYFLAWESVQLPSKGLFYDNMPDGMIKIKPMGVDVDLMMANQRIVQSGELLNKIIEACVQLPSGMTVGDMLSGDQHFLLYYLRGITHGINYEFIVECPACGHKNTYEYNLSNLAKTIKGPNPDYITEPMCVKLPVLTEKMGHVVGGDIEAMVRLVRVKDLTLMNSNKGIDMNDRMIARNKNDRQRAKIDNPSEIYLNNMNLQIVGFRINGKDFTDHRKSMLISKLQQQDSATIKQFIDDISPGIDTTIEVTCQDTKCNNEYSISLPFGEKFFRPGK